MPEVSNAFVICLGLGTVFVGLICLVLLCGIMSAVVRAFTKNKETAPAPKAAPAPAAKPVADAPIENKQAIIAGTCAVIAEELGTDVKNIRVVSFKRV